MDPAAGVYRLPGGGMFAVVGPYNGQSATVGNGTMIGFALESHAAVDAFHAKALELGGTDEGAPGPRGPAEAKAYMAYMRDLDGNKIKRVQARLRRGLAKEPERMTIEVQPHADVEAMTHLNEAQKQKLRIWTRLQDTA